MPRALNAAPTSAPSSAPSSSPTLFRGRLLRRGLRRGALRGRLRRRRPLPRLHRRSGPRLAVLAGDHRLAARGPALPRRRLLHPQQPVLAHHRFVGAQARGHERDHPADAGGRAFPVLHGVHRHLDQHEVRVGAAFLEIGLQRVVPERVDQRLVVLDARRARDRQVHIAILRRIGDVDARVAGDLAHLRRVAAHEEPQHLAVELGFLRAQRATDGKPVLADRREHRDVDALHQGTELVTLLRTGHGVARCR